MEATAHGDGPVEAAVQAINRITGIAPTMESYRIQAVTGGGDALGEVSISARHGETCCTAAASPPTSSNPAPAPGCAFRT